MSHIDPDDLAILALGDPIADADHRAHLAVCPVCEAELAEIASVVRAARRLPETELQTPSPQVWDAIAREISEPVAVTDGAPAPGAPTRRSTGHRVGRRSRLRTRLLIGGASILSAAAAIVLIVTLTAPRPVDIATATLDAFPGHPGAAGTAALEREPDGTERIIVDLEAELASDGHREVWLLTEDGSALVSLGVLDGSGGTFVVPADVDTARYSVVDISQEPDDGNAAHSGDSIVRGALERS